MAAAVTPLDGVAVALLPTLTLKVCPANQRRVVVCSREYKPSLEGQVLGILQREAAHAAGARGLPSQRRHRWCEIDQCPQVCRRLDQLVEAQRRRAAFGSQTAQAC